MTETDRELLREAARHAGYPPSEANRFCEAVEKRLRQGAVEYGEHGYLRRSFTECMGEASEEQHDAGGWTALALRLLDSDVARGLPSDVAALIRLHALQGVAAALQSERAFREAVALYEEHADKVESVPSEPERPFSVCSDERLELTTAPAQPRSRSG